VTGGDDRPVSRPSPQRIFTESEPTPAYGPRSIGSPAGSRRALEVPVSTPRPRSPRSASRTPRGTRVALP
jgi:hypothetical protein